MMIQAEIYILGCGNILLGDDGFGPRVADYLIANYPIPENVQVINAGSSVREILFNLLLGEKTPGKVVIIDAVDCGERAGEIFALSLNDLPHNKIDDFSMHQLPTSNLLYELKEHCGIEVLLLCCQVRSIPEEVQPGLSPSLEAKVPEVAKILAEKFLA